MEALSTTVLLIGYFITITGFLAGIIKLWRKIKAIGDGQQCQLRNDITSIYYEHNGEAQPTLREYERKNLDDLVAGYKALGGNHYVDDIYATMRQWKVVD